MATQVQKTGNWGRWGQDDERGALNLIDAAKVRDAAHSVKTGKVYQLALPIQRSGIPLAEHRGTPQRLTLTNHEDEWMAQGFGGAPGVGFNEDIFIFAAHTSTHMDALGHVYSENKLYNGYPNDQASPFQGAARCSIDKIGSVAGRGVLIDVAGSKGVSVIDSGYAITGDDLATALAEQDVELRVGDIVLIRTGWVEEFLRQPNLDIVSNPGIGMDGAQFLIDHDVALVGSDNLALEVMPFDKGKFLGVHVMLLVEHGIHLIENMNLEELSADRCYEFLFSVAPLKVTGATGSPVSPFAIG